MAESCLLYYITDRAAFAGDESARCRLLLEKISEAAHAGIDYIQLREKDLPARDLEILASEAIGIIRRLRTQNGERPTRLLINSRTDIAVAANADGVHLRSNDIFPLEVKAIWNKCGVDTLVRQLTPAVPLIAVSCHSPAEAIDAAAQAATFAVFAPVFGKPDTPAAGLAQLAEACRTNIPVLALGGITLANAHSCLDAGAAGIAAIRLFQENNIGEVVRHLRDTTR